MMLYKIDVKILGCYLPISKLLVPLQCREEITIILLTEFLKTVVNTLSQR